jgi:hypothetical protein
MTDFRNAIAQQIESELQIRVRPGRLGPQEGKDVACVWPVAVYENPDNVAEEVLEAGVGIWLNHKHRGGPEEPFDPTRLEEVAEQLQVALSEIETNVPIWYFRIVRIDYDLEAQGLEALAQGTQFSKFTQST